MKRNLGFTFQRKAKQSGFTFTKTAGFTFTKTAGFTLLELIIAIAILSVISSLSLTILNPFTQLQKAADVKRKSDLAQISKALEAYYSDHGKYPGVNGSYEMVVVLAGDNTPTALSWGSAWAPYMDTLPKDSNGNKNYVYYAPTTGAGAYQSFFLYASLDRGTKDPQACTGETGCPNLPSGASCGSGICNYGVSSSNVSP